MLTSLLCIVPFRVAATLETPTERAGHPAGDAGSNLLAAAAAGATAVAVMKAVFRL
jgi:hypothetical protein